MNEDHSDPGPLEWEYAPPPTIYDLVTDSFLLGWIRVLISLLLRPVMRYYCRLTVIGRDNATGNWPCVIAPNHSSHLDTVAIFCSLPLSHINRTCSLAAKDYFFENAFMAMVARLIGNGIPIDRTGSDKTGLLLCAARQREGRSIVIFPEGTRTTTGDIGSFKKGAVLLSRGALVPVVPTYIDGARESLPKSGYLPRRQRITIVFGEPVCCWEGSQANLDPEASAKDIEDRVRLLKRDLGKTKAER